MDKHLLPFFFSNIKTTSFVAAKSQYNQKNVVFSSKMGVIMPKSCVFLPIDVLGVDFCKTGVSLSHVYRTTAIIIINSVRGGSLKAFNMNTGLNWPFRELIELFGVTEIKVSDSRNLLLDYSTNLNPLKKEFPCEGVEEVYFNFLDQKVKKFKIFFIEI